MPEPRASQVEPFQEAMLDASGPVGPPARLKRPRMTRRAGMGPGPSGSQTVEETTSPRRAVRGLACQLSHWAAACWGRGARKAKRSRAPRMGRGARRLEFNFMSALLGVGGGL